MFGDPRYNPNKYDVHSLNEITDIISGITKGRKPRSDELRNVPYICTANVQDGYIDWNEVKYIEATEEEIKKYSLQVNDILIIEGGDPDKVGRGCLINDFPPYYIHQNHVFRVRPNNSIILPEFLSAYLLLPSTKEYFLFCAKQTTGIATINKKQLSELKIMHPPIALQKMYIDFLKLTDKSKFELTQALEALNVTYKKLISENLG